MISSQVVITEMPEATKTASGLVCLVVDDSPMDRRIASSLLENGLGARVITANHGLDALKILRKEQPDLVLTDMQMPEMNGLELVEVVRSNYPTLPIMVMTANGSEDLAMRALQAGAASYVPKYLLAQSLVSTAETILSAARQERRRGQVLECVTRLECEFELDNDPALVPHLIANLQEQMLRMQICNANGKIRLGVALEEALLNGLYHGNLELSSDLRQDGSNRFKELAEKRRHLTPYRNRRVHVRVRLSTTEASFVIRDEGPGFDTTKIPDPTDPENLLKASGRGMLLIRTFMDEVFHNPIGNQITMIKRCKKAE